MYPDFVHNDLKELGLCFLDIEDETGPLHLSVLSIDIGRRKKIIEFTATDSDSFSQNLFLWRQRDPVPNQETIGHSVERFEVLSEEARVVFNPEEGLHIFV
jgi:hypothetical protein